MHMFSNRLQRYYIFLNCTNLFCIFSDFRHMKNEHVYRDKNLPFAFHLRCILDPFTSESRIPPDLIYTTYISRDFRNSSFLPYTTKNDIHLRICHFSCKPNYYASENWSLPTPQMGQTQSAGSSSSALPSSLGSYSYPQTSQMRFSYKFLQFFARFSGFWSILGSTFF